MFQSHLLPMSLENMNKLAFCPCKDYKANRLKSGVLQLADNTHLVLDETALQPGQLDVHGGHVHMVILGSKNITFLTKPSTSTLL